MDETANCVCGTCGEEIVLALDPSAGSRQEYVEDCPVCCRPNLIRVSFGPDGLALVEVDREA